MDTLIRVRSASDGLMAQVDASLSRDGAAEGHEIWPLLRRIGLLPGDALACAADWLPPVLVGRAALLRRHREAQADVSASMTGLSGWDGAAAAAFHARLSSTRAELAVAEQTSGSLSACLDELADWLTGGRHRLARTLATSLTSAEAVTLTVGPFSPGRSVRAEAAAAIGASVLTEVDLFWQTGLEIWQRHAARADVTALSTLDSTVEADATLSVDR